VRRARRRTLDLHRDVVDVAPDPFLARLEALDDRVGRLVEVAGRVPAGRVVAAPDVSALEAAAQVHPVATLGEALDATVAAGRRVEAHRLEVRAIHHRVLSSSSAGIMARAVKRGISGRVRE
jgi:hypothetical protein